MKLFDDKQYEDLEHAFKTAYHARKAPELSIHWRQHVMRAVRSIGPLTATFNPVMFAQRFVWRFVTAACIVVVMMLGYMWYFGVNPFYDVRELLLEDSVQLVALQEVYEEL
jgi:hypothetical protein